MTSDGHDPSETPPAAPIRAFYHVMETSTPPLRKFLDPDGTMYAGTMVRENEPGVFLIKSVPGPMDPENLVVGKVAMLRPEEETVRYEQALLRDCLGDSATPVHLYSLLHIASASGRPPIPSVKQIEALLDHDELVGLQRDLYKRAAALIEAARTINRIHKAQDELKGNQNA